MFTGMQEHHRFVAANASVGELHMSDKQLFLTQQSPA